MEFEGVIYLKPERKGVIYLKDFNQTVNWKFSQTQVHNLIQVSPLEQEESSRFTEKAEYEVTTERPITPGEKHRYPESLIGTLVPASFGFLKP